MAALLNWDRDGAASLFERIQGNGVSYKHSSLKELVQSIKYNLLCILNTHPGASQSAPELGIADLNDATIDTVDISIRVKSIIERCILDFEPRIVNVDVQPMINEDEPLRLRFRIKAILSIEYIGHPIVFNLHLDNDRHYYLDLADLEMSWII